MNKIPDHVRAQCIHAAIVAAAQQHPTPERARAAAKSQLREQKIRATDAEIDRVADMPLKDILWPRCECMPLDDAALFREIADKETPGPHHVVSCPKWRAVRP